MPELPSSPTHAPAPSRERWVGSALAVAAVVAALWGWMAWRSAPPLPPPAPPAPSLVR